MLTGSYRKRLEADLPRWVAEGWLSAENAGAIRRSVVREQGGIRLPALLGLLGGLLIAASVAAFVAAVETHLAAGGAGLGVLGLPTYMASAPRARGELVPLFEDWQLDPMPLYLAFPPNRHVSLKLRVFIDWIVELMARRGPGTMRMP